MFGLIGDSSFIYWGGEGLAPNNYHWP